MLHILTVQFISNFHKTFPRILQSLGHCRVLKMFLWFSETPMANDLLLPASAKDFPVVAFKNLATSLPSLNLILSKSSITPFLTTFQSARSKFETVRPACLASASEDAHRIASSAFLSPYLEALAN